MQAEIRILEDSKVWSLLTETPYPPKTLYIKGELGSPDLRRVTIVGSRQCSQYARQVVDEICASLKGQPVSIVSGLAHGIDTQAHQSALKYGLHTVAVVGSGLADEVLYPKSNYRLAQKILESGGALISEYEEHFRSQIWMFPARNRIMVGTSEVIIVIEAREKSGTLITARLATDYNRELMVVPNSIHALGAKGSNELIRQGAHVYTKPEDLFALLGLKYEKENVANYDPSPDEQRILNEISNGATSLQSIITACAGSLSTSQVVQALLNLEIENVIKRIDGQYVRLT